MKEQTEAINVTETKGPSKFQGKSRPNSTPSAPLNLPHSKTEPTASVADSGNAATPPPLELPFSEGSATKLAAGSSHAAALQPSSSQPWAASNVSRDAIRRVHSLDSHHVAATSLQQVTDAAEAKNARLRAQIDQILNELERKDNEIAGWFALAAAVSPLPSRHAVVVRFAEKLQAVELAQNKLKEEHDQVSEARAATRSHASTAA